MNTSSPSETVTCYVAIGSNLNKPLEQVTQATHVLSRTMGITLKRRSPWYISKAIGPGEQENYINGVLEIETTLSPGALLSALQSIENQQGRTREVRWGSRTLDLDILLYNQLRMDTPALQIPHPRIQERPFVLAPLVDLNPTLVLNPGANRPSDSKNETIAALLAHLSREGLWLAEGETGPITF